MPIQLEEIRNICILRSPFNMLVSVLIEVWGKRYLASNARRVCVYGGKLLLLAGIAVPGD